MRQHLKAGSAFVYRYKDERGVEYAMPINMDMKSRLPSDHYPLVFELENIKLL